MQACLHRHIDSLQLKNESENILKNSKECSNLQKYQFFKLDAGSGTGKRQGMILVLHSSSALVVHYGSDVAHDSGPKKSFSFPFDCQIGTNTKSAMEKEPWIKKTQSSNPAGVKAI